MTDRQPPNSDHDYPQQYAEDEIELMDLLRVLWNYKFFILAFLIVSAGVAAVYAVKKYPTTYSTVCTILLSFDGIEKGENPDGSAFRPEQIITPKILSRAAGSLEGPNGDEAGKELLVKYIRDAVSIERIVRQDVADRENRTDEEKEVIYFPNRFRLSFTTERDKRLDDKSRKNLLRNIVREYHKSFLKRYGSAPAPMVHLDNEFIQNNDYNVIVKAFRGGLDRLIQYLARREKRALLFISLDTNLSFGQLRSKAVLLLDTYVAEAQTLVQALNISKDQQRAVQRLEASLRKRITERKKREAEASVAVELLEEMVRLVGSGSANGSELAETGLNLSVDSSFLERLQENDWRSFLIKKALAARTAAEETNVEEAVLTEKINELQELSEQEMADNVRTVESIIKALQAELSVLCERTRTLSIEWAKQAYGNAVKVVDGPATVEKGAGKRKQIVVLSLVAGLFIGCFLAFFVAYIRKYNE